MLMYKCDACGEVTDYYFQKGTIKITDKISLSFDRGWHYSGSGELVEAEIPNSFHICKKCIKVAIENYLKSI